MHWDRWFEVSGGSLVADRAPGRMRPTARRPRPPQKKTMNQAPRPEIKWNPDRRRWRLPSDPRCLKELRRIIEGQASSLGYRDDTIHDLMVAVHEAVMNAIVHGNQRVVNRHVEIWWEKNAFFWVIRVRDEGEGFDTGQALRAMRGEKRPQPESGRGLLIIAQLVDRVTFADRGQEIVLWKALPPDE